MWNEDAFRRALAKLPKLRSNERVKTEDQIIKMHLFLGGTDWWIAEGDAKEGVLFGFCCLNGDWQNAEWGDVSIEELIEIRAPLTTTDRKTKKSTTRNEVQVDFDLHWKEQKFSEVPAIKDHLYFDPDSEASEKELIAGSEPKEPKGKSPKEKILDDIAKEKENPSLPSKNGATKGRILWPPQDAPKAQNGAKNGAKGQTTLKPEIVQDPPQKEPKIEVKYIIIERGEGLSSECGKPLAAKTFEEIDHILFNWSYTAPKGGAYDKCDFLILFKDGKTYQGRYDLHREPEKNETLREHVLDFLLWNVGKAKNPYCGMERYLELMEEEDRLNPEQRIISQEYLDKYALEA